MRVLIEGFEGVLRVLNSGFTSGLRVRGFRFDLQCKFLSFVPSFIRCCWLTFVYPSRGMREKGGSGHGFRVRRQSENSHFWFIEEGAYTTVFVYEGFAAGVDVGVWV
jgi:hypothetical protein